MQFEALSRIQSVMNRIQDIQVKVGQAPIKDISQAPAGTSFDSMLQKAIAAQNAPPMSGYQGAGYPPLLNSPMGGYSPVASWINSMATSDPQRLIQYQGYNMQAQTASRFLKLEDMIRQAFPGRQVTVTSTTEGQHTDPNHPAGKAVDFVVDGLTKDESKIVEDLSARAGFTAYNEYINDSPYKTGDHMHVSLAE
ncbi:MAG: hypothetical protein V2A78_06605 [bacterium]